jgi:regulator of cell morphogenesis and NO signaling
MKLDEFESVGELATIVPDATPVMERFRIDYCCGGSASIAEACNKAGVSVTDLEMAIEKRLEQPTERSWENASAMELIDHILEHYHVRTRQDLEVLNQTSAKVASVHGERHPNVVALRELVTVLIGELMPHMMKEEQVLFPFARDLDAAVTNGAMVGSSCFGTVQNPIRMMEYEHDQAGELLLRIRKATNDFELPEDACATFQTLYRTLEGFERLTHQHIHLENNILFPKLIELESKVAAPV